MKLATTMLYLFLLFFPGCVNSSQDEVTVGKPGYEKSKKLAEQGNAVGQYNLGMFYRIGTVVPQNYGEAIKWLKLSAEQGQSEAQFNLGVMYANGDGVTKDSVQSHKWLSLAESSGHQKAHKAKLLLEKGMTAEQIDDARDRHGRG